MSDVSCLHDLEKRLGNLMTTQLQKARGDFLVRFREVLQGDPRFKGQAGELIKLAAGLQTDPKHLMVGLHKAAYQESSGVTPLKPPRRYRVIRGNTSHISRPETMEKVVTYHLQKGSLLGTGGFKSLKTMAYELTCELETEDTGKGDMTNVLLEEPKSVLKENTGDEAESDTECLEIEEDIRYETLHTVTVDTENRMRVVIDGDCEHAYRCDPKSGILFVEDPTGDFLAVGRAELYEDGPRVEWFEE